MNKSQITMKENEYFHIASGYYIYECLPCDYNEMTNDELEDFLAEGS